MVGPWHSLVMRCMSLRCHKSSSKDSCGPSLLGGPVARSPASKRVFPHQGFLSFVLAPTRCASVSDLRWVSRECIGTLRMVCRTVRGRLSIVFVSCGHTFACSYSRILVKAFHRTGLKTPCHDAHLVVPTVRRFSTLRCALVTSGMTNRASNLIPFAIGLGAAPFETYNVHKHLHSAYPRPYSELTLSAAVGSWIFAGSNPFFSSRITIDNSLPGRMRHET
jgi:hypothetical protein